MSILSGNGVTVEAISGLARPQDRDRHAKVYRHPLKPVITTGATTKNTIFNREH